MNLSRRAMAPPWIIARLAAVSVLAAGSMVLSSTAASAAPQCSFDSANHSLSVSLSATDVVAQVKVNAGNLEVEGVACAAMSSLNTIVIDASSDPSVYLIISLATGLLGPGYTDEGNGSSEIEVTVNGLNSSSTLRIDGTNGNDKVTLGWLNNKVTGYTAGEINLNGLADGATPDNDISFPGLPGLIIVNGLDGDDVISGSGTGTVYTGQIYVPMQLGGDYGSNQVTGGGGDDHIEIFEGALPDGPDTLSGGAGFDTVLGSTPTVVVEPAFGSITLDGLANDGNRCPGSECSNDMVSSDFEAIQGSPFREYIAGNAAAQLLTGGGGDDLVQGLGGDDTFICADGTYEGGAGTDLFKPEDFTHAATCGSLSGGSGEDTVDFRIWKSPVNFSLDNLPNDGGSGTVLTNIHSDVENLIGTKFADTISGSGRANVLDGLAGTDSLLGKGGNDTLLGRGGPDKLNGGPDTDVCKQGPGTGVLLNCEST